MFEALLNRHTVLSRPGVGRLVVSARRWSPSDVHAIRFQPEGSDAVHEVPEPAWETVLAAQSFEEVMAAIRSVPDRD